MKNFIYRLLFILVSVSVFIDVSTWLMLKAGLRAGYLLMTNISFALFSEPIPIFVVQILGYRYGLTVELFSKALMLFLVTRRLFFIFKNRTFEASSNNFSQATYVMALIGLGALLLSITPLAIPGSSEGKLVMLSLWFVLAFAVAKFLIPFTFLVNELWLLRKNHGNKALTP
ncbi:MAG: hypothetical protein OEL83_04425 [Desulforhopalus sp.]|nr:hypothetical protein [Desulforhopalus sp.]